jgi:hypothetical protein
LIVVDRTKKEKSKPEKIGLFRLFDTIVEKQNPREKARLPLVTGTLDASQPARLTTNHRGRQGHV